jgi:phosphoglycolate phosphatase
MQRTMVLDLDGTIANSLPDLLAAVNRSLAANGLPVLGLAELAPMVGDGGGVLLRRAFAVRGAAVSDEMVTGFVRDYAGHVAEATVAYPGVPETLERFRGQGWRLAVCTNKPLRPAEALLGRLGLAGFFAAVCGGDSFAVRKPDPAHLLGTIQAAGGDARRAVMAGDHANDIIAASGADVPGVFAAWGYGDVAMAAGASAIAGDITDLPDIAARLLAE